MNFRDRSLLIGWLTFFFCAPSQALEFPKTEMTRTQAVEHLLNRAAFGPRPTQIAELTPPKKLEAWLETQLQPASIDDSAVETKLKSLCSTTMTGKQLFENYLTTPDATREQMNSRFIFSELAVRKIVRAAESKRELEQVLLDFWFNHFSVDRNFPHYLPLYEREAIAPHLFGRFEDMLTAVAKHPAMLYYLDNWRSAKVGATLAEDLRTKIEWAYPPPGGRNDNYAREILELHTVGPDAGYTEKDIEGVSRVFTGWTISKEKSDPGFVFVPTWHDETDVVIMGRRYSGKKGADEGLALIHDLAMHPKTVETIAKKLCLRFVQDPPPAACVKRMTKSYLAGKGDLTALYRELFTSTEFWNPKGRRTRFKGPFEFVASSLRALGSDVVLDGSFIPGINLMMAKSGHQPYACRVPNGYYESDAAWSNAASTLWRSLVAPKLVEIARTKTTVTAMDLVSPEFQRR